MTQIADITKKLEEFGLSSIEAEVYLYLLNKDPQTILGISRNLSIPRTTIYDVGRLLIEKGLVERVIEYKRQKLRAFSIDILASVISQEKDRLAKLSKNLIFLKKNLVKKVDLNTQTQVRYYSGATGFKQMMWNSLKAQKEHFGYSELGWTKIVGHKFMRQWMEEMIRRKIQDRVIINPKKETLAYLTDQEENSFRKKYQITRILDEKQLYISGDTTIYNNIFAVAWWKQKEVVGVEIENFELVKTQIAIFEIIWKQAKPVT